MTGTIKTLNKKGFGFISADDVDELMGDYFFHANDLVDTKFDDLTQGDSVAFESQETEKGKNAIEVTPV